jgi:hypothetical protein
LAPQKRIESTAARNCRFGLTCLKPSHDATDYRQGAEGPFGMIANPEPWWENSQNTAFAVAAVVMAIVILGLVADWTGYLRTSPPQPPVDVHSEEPTQP